MGRKLAESYDVDYTFCVSETLRRDSWCFCYTVYWKDGFNIDLPTWKYKAFHSFNKAKEFAKKMWKQHKALQLKPYILKTIVPCTFFRKEFFLELDIVSRERYGTCYTKRVF